MRTDLGCSQFLPAISCSALDSPPAGATPDGDAILGHILGDRRITAERGIAGASGLDLAKVGPLLSMLAPVVMGALGRARRQGNLGPGQLSEVLAREGAALGGSSGIMGLVADVVFRYVLKNMAYRYDVKL